MVRFQCKVEQLVWHTRKELANRNILRKRLDLSSSTWIYICTRKLRTPWWWPDLCVGKLESASQTHPSPTAWDTQTAHFPTSPHWTWRCSRVCPLLSLWAALGLVYSSFQRNYLKLLKTKALLWSLSRLSILRSRYSWPPKIKSWAGKSFLNIHSTDPCTKICLNDGHKFLAGASTSFQLYQPKGIKKCSWCLNAAISCPEILKRFKQPCHEKHLHVILSSLRSHLFGDLECCLCFDCVINSMFGCCCINLWELRAGPLRWWEQEHQCRLHVVLSLHKTPALAIFIGYLTAFPGLQVQTHFWMTSSVLKELPLTTILAEKQRYMWHVLMCLMDRVSMCSCMVQESTPYTHIYIFILIHSCIQTFIHLCIHTCIHSCIQTVIQLLH